ncbi:hypothetical protein TYRP_008374 [Tyrophagus putrescentiae]|nr:hypothetical protein TYRP_008374 [Tyrophagus putrescentiae]
MPNFLEAPLLPLPSLQTYSSISLVFLSCSLYYAFQITSEPNWKSNSSYAINDVEQNTLNEATQLNDTLSRTNFFSDLLERHNASLIINDLFQNQHFLRLYDVGYIMVHEPLCVWTLINMGYCLLILLGKVIQKLIFGDLRASEHQLLRDKFWNFLIYKFIFVFSVINVQYMDELVLWCAWFSVLGFMLVLTYLCKERFNYLTFSPAVSKWVHVRLLTLLLLIISSTIPLFIVGIIVGMHTNFSIGAFLISECTLLFLRTIYCVILYMIHLWDISRESIWEKRASITYYIELTFDLLILSIEFCHHFHMLFWGNIILSVSTLVIVFQLRALFNDINRRIKKHKNYLQVLNLMEENFSVASDDELARNNDDCAICWDQMKAARKLPCGHLFHTTCLRSWLEQDTSCPTCRHSLRHREDDINEPPPAEGENGAEPARGLFGNAANHRFANHFFHFDGSRYSRWLPSVSVELSSSSVININASLNRPEFVPDFGQQQMEFMGQQVLEWFPQISLNTILEDLRNTRSVEHTIENILDGRLPTAPSSNEASTSSSAFSTTPTDGPSEQPLPVPSSPLEPSTSTSRMGGGSGAVYTLRFRSSEARSETVPSEPVPGPSSRAIIDEQRPSTSSYLPTPPPPIVSDEGDNRSEQSTEEAPKTSPPPQSDDIQELGSRFLQLSSDERRSLLTQRRDEMVAKARQRYLQKSSNNNDM